MITFIRGADLQLGKPFPGSPTMRSERGSGENGSPTSGSNGSASVLARSVTIGDCSPLSFYASLNQPA
jgi:hypothetical protein